MRSDKLTSKFQAALAEAQSLALGRDHQIIEPAHVGLALLQQEGGTVRPLLEALEEQVVVLRLIGEVESGTVLVRIGEENAHEALVEASFVSVGYGSGDRALGGLGVVGPTRMDYPGNMAAVRAVARYVGQLLAES